MGRKRHVVIFTRRHREEPLLERLAVRINVCERQNLLQGAVVLAQVGKGQTTEVVSQPRKLGDARCLGGLEHQPVDVVLGGVEGGAGGVELASSVPGGGEGPSVVPVRPRWNKPSSPGCRQAQKGQCRTHSLRRKCTGTGWVPPRAHGGKGWDVVGGVHPVTVVLVGGACHDRKGHKNEKGAHALIWFWWWWLMRELCGLVVEVGWVRKREEKGETRCNKNGDSQEPCCCY